MARAPHKYYIHKFSNVNALSNEFEAKIKLPIKLIFILNMYIKYEIMNLTRLY